MQGVVLLSEINPNGVESINPLRQAADWFDLIPKSDIRHLRNGDEDDFRMVIRQMYQKVSDRDETLILRDWSHVDFVGFPFNDQPSRELELAKSLSPEFDVLNIASVRNPIDQYLSMKKLTLLNHSWNEGAVWQGIRAFAEQIQDLYWFRYEDFLNNPDKALQDVCNAWEIPFDPSYRDQWYEYVKVTGDRPPLGRREIRPNPDRIVPETVWGELVGNPDVVTAFDLLGYPLPDRLKRWKRITQSAGVNSLDDLLMCADTADSDGRTEEAINQLREILSIYPGNVEARNRLAGCLLKIGDLAESYQILCGVLLDSPDSVPALRSMVHCLFQQDRRFDAIPHQARLCQLCPDDLNNLFAYSTALTGIGAVDEAMTYCQRVLRKDPHNYGIATNYLLFTNYKDDLTAAEIAREHFRIATRFSSEEDFSPSSQRRSDKVRVGYVSADFKIHPVGKIFEGILCQHDRSRFELYAYHDSDKTDALTTKVIENVDSFREIHGTPNDEVLALIRNDNLDVLFDLGGFSGGGNRLKVFARRAAPVQVSFLGYPNTTALHTMDYRLTDSLADPPGDSDEFYSEQLIRLDCSHLAWVPYDCVKEVHPKIHSGPLRIGSFNNVAKISNSAIDCWAKILRRCPSVILHMKYGDRFEVKLVQDRFYRLFAERGVLPERIRFHPCCPTYKQHLETVQEIDLALDSFPYQGTMTSLETLSVGTPIVSKAGEYYAHRATSAMVERIGFPELVARTNEEYVEIACQILNDAKGLRALKSHVRSRFHEGALVNTREFTQQLETAILDMVSL